MTAIDTGIQYSRLQNTLQIAQHFTQSSYLYFYPEPAFPIPSEFELDFDLQLPEDVKIRLSSPNISHERRRIISTTISNLQTQYRKAFERVYEQSPQRSAVPQLRALLKDMFFNRAVPDIMKRFIPMKPASWNEEPRPQFNANHTPLLLMIYTHYTPYPTAAERFAVAEYTQMSERQIEVWFQNHRRIQKKAGFPPSRVRGPSGGVEALLASLPSPSYSQPTPEPERHPDEDSEKKYFSLTRPAFPGPPSSDFIPVPAPPADLKGKGKGKEVPPSFLRPVPFPAHAFHFDAPWPRAAPSTPTPKPPAPTMDALTDLFACMNVHSPAQDSEGEAATARYTTDLRGRSAAYVGEGAWQSWSWSWHGWAGLLSVEWGKSSWGTRRKSAKRTSWKPYSKPQPLPRRAPSSSALCRVPSSPSSSSSSSSSRVPSWGSQTEAPHSPASSYTSYSPSPSPPPGFVLAT
ncbi:hypothetical protein F5146DRAFT_111920 [Armillaria mellea]|nr:hypothetical protein F5146DRAFT_111920 [Armillaria mellea]